MLDTLANSGAEIDDTPFILKAQEACRQIQAAVERAIDAGEISVDDVFDRDYKIVEGSNPVQYDVRFNDAADKLRPADPRPHEGQRQPHHRLGDRRHERLSADPPYASAAIRRGRIRCGTTSIAATSGS